MATRNIYRSILITYFVTTCIVSGEMAKFYDLLRDLHRRIVPVLQCRETMISMRVD